MRSLLERLKSRKFLACVVGIITGLAMVFGLDENVITTVAGAVTALASLITYIVVEGRIDAAGVAKTAEAVEKARDAVTE